MSIKKILVSETHPLMYFPLQKGWKKLKINDAHTAILKELEGMMPEELDENGEVLLPAHIALNHDPKAQEYFIADEKCRRQGYNAAIFKMRKALADLKTRLKGTNPQEPI